MSTIVLAIKPPDKKWKQMKAVWDACKAAGVAPPDDVSRFFEGVPPDPDGVVVDLVYSGHPCCEEWEKEMKEGYQIDVTKLPKSTRYLRFYNSW